MQLDTNLPALVASVASGDVARGLGERLQALLAYEVGVDEFSVSVSGVLGAIIVLLLVGLLSRLMQKGFTRYAQRQQEELRPAIYTVSRLAKYLLIVIGIMTALSLLGIPMTQFAVLAGAIGVGLGFGLQAIFANFISGLVLLFDRSLKVGDFVELESGVHGEVREISIRATRIVTNDNIDILVPNSEFVTGRVVNWTLGDGISRMRVPFGVDYDIDKELVKRVAVEAAAEVPFTLTMEGERKPQLWLVEYADSTVNFELVVWLTAQATKLPDEAKAAYKWAIDDALRRHGIALPYPTTDLDIRGLFGLEGLDALRALHGQLPANDPAATADAPATSTTNDALQGAAQKIADDPSEQRAADDGRSDNDSRA